MPNLIICHCSAAHLRGEDSALYKHIILSGPTFHESVEGGSILSQLAVPLVGHHTPRPSKAHQHGRLHWLLQRQVCVAVLRSDTDQCVEIRFEVLEEFNIIEMLCTLHMGFISFGKFCFIQGGPERMQQLWFLLYWIEYSFPSNLTSSSIK